MKLHCTVLYEEAFLASSVVCGRFPMEYGKFVQHYYKPATNTPPVWLLQVRLSCPKNFVWLP